MNEFENKLIKEEVYKNGLYAKIPNFKKRGSAFILTGGCNDNLLVSEKTTTKEIRQGKYTHLVEVSTLAYRKEIRFSSPGRETAYSFEVYVKAVIQVDNPLTFYENKNIDVDSYFNNLFSLDVRKITRKYSILNYDGMDEELKEKLSSYDTVDESTGFSYRISVVDAEPGEKAQKYVYEQSTQQLDMGIKEHARNLIPSLAKSYEEAIQTEIVRGNLSEEEGIKRIQQYKEENFDVQTKRLEELREKGFLTDKQARNYLNPSLEDMSSRPQTQMAGEEFQQDRFRTSNFEGFYAEEEKE